MIYLYFDSKGVLKERINDIVNCGDKNVNKIAVYWEDDVTALYRCGIRYQMSGQTFWPTPDSPLYANYVASGDERYILYNKDQDLKYFKYGTAYPFRVFVIPQEILLNETDDNIPVVASVYFTQDDVQKVMDKFAFNVGPSSLGVRMDEHINLAEWNSLVRVLANKQLFIVDEYDKIVPAQHVAYDMFFAVDEQAFYYLDASRNLQQWMFGLTFDTTPANGSSNPVTSSGIYNWVLSQISNLGGLKAHICEDAEDTPYDVVWGDNIQGELLPDDALPSTLYLVPNDDNTYTEYFPIYTGSDYEWEVIGSTNIGLPDAPVTSGTYKLTCTVSGGVASYSWSKTEIESFSISAWTTDNSISPFSAKAVVTYVGTIGENSLVSLINDNAILFGTYGFSIGAISGQNITIYALTAPSSSVTLKIKKEEL